MADIARVSMWPIGLVVAAALGASGIAQSRQVTPALAGDELVRVTVGVERSNGSHVRGLKAEDFDVVSDGQARPIQYFSAADEPVAIVFLTDETASMPGRGNLRMDAAIDGALLLRRTPRDRIRVGGFARSLVLSPRFDTEWPELHWAASVVRDIPTADRVGPSPLWDGVDTAVKALETEPGRRAILMITDGRSTGNVHSVAEVMNHANAANVSINVVAVPSGTTVAQNRMTYARMRPYLQLEQMTRATGGAYAEMGEFPDLAPLLVRGIIRLHELYTIGFPPAVLDGREHGLAVSVKQTGVRVRVKTRYVARGSLQIPPGTGSDPTTQHSSGFRIQSFGECCVLRLTSRRLVMRKFLTLLVLAIGVCAVAVSALTGHPNMQTAQATADLTLRLNEKTTIEFVPIAAGRFLMGSKNGDRDERPVHDVTISRAFELGKYEVIEAQWNAVMGGNPWRWGLKQPLDRSQGSLCGGTCPEGRVSWEGVQQFVARLNERLDAYTYRLPTEAEWEYAARAGTTGDFAGDLYRLGWHKGNSDDYEHPLQVGQKRPNPWGLYDMHGNVWEWVSDWYAASYPSSAVTDPTGPSEGKYRVYRGGSWVERFGECRSANRSWGGPGGRDAAVGFRLLRVKPKA